MVISRNDAKRRRKEGDSLEDSLQGSPKRTKVHAQRKFAQGSSNLNSPALTPVKDKDKVKTNGTVLSPELIPSKRPKTEDFLTFLCFRGTPILPPQLDFFNVASVQDGQDEEQGSSQGDCSSSRMTSMASTGHKPQRSGSMEQATCSNVSRRGEKVESDTRKKPTTAVQAIRKKYKEQRLAKQRASTLTKLVQKVKGKNMVRTRSATIREESRPLALRKLRTKKRIIKKSSGKEVQVLKKMKPLKYMQLRRMSARPQRKPNRDLRHHPIRRGGLRSGGQLPPGSEEGLKSDRGQPFRPSVREKKEEGLKSDRGVQIKPVVKDRKEDGLKSDRSQQIRHSIKDKKVVPERNKAKVFVSSLSDFSSDDDQPLVKRTRPLEPSTKQQLARKVVKRIVKSSRKLRPYMITRSKQQQQQQQQSVAAATRVSSRPTRKTKEAAALYMELLGKKLITPDAEADEDSLSIDSFPELPNSRRNEQRENEIKARLSRERKDSKHQKKDNQFLRRDPKKDIQSQKRDTSAQKKEDNQSHKKENTELRVGASTKSRFEVRSLEIEEAKGTMTKLRKPSRNEEVVGGKVEKIEEVRGRITRLKEADRNEEARSKSLRPKETDRIEVRTSKSRELEKIDDYKGRNMKTREAEKIEESKAKGMMTREAEKNEVRGKVLKFKVVEKTEEMKNKMSKLKDTDIKIDEPKGRTVKTKDDRNDDTRGRVMKDKDSEKFEEVKGRISRIRETDKNEEILMKGSKDSEKNDEIKGRVVKCREVDKMEEVRGRIIKLKEGDKLEEIKGRISKTREIDKSDDAKGRISKLKEIEKCEDNKAKLVKTRESNRFEEVKSKAKELDRTEELKGRFTKNIKDVDKVEENKGKLSKCDKVEEIKGKCVKYKDTDKCEEVKEKVLRTKDPDKFKPDLGITKELAKDSNVKEKVSEDLKPNKNSKKHKKQDTQKHGEEKERQKQITTIRSNKKERKIDEKPRSSRHSLRNRSYLVKKQNILDSDDDSEVDEDGMTMKPPIAPRRSLRRSSRDRSQYLSDSFDNLSVEMASTRSSSRRSSCTSLSPIGRQLHRFSKASTDSSEDKFSESDEEPLGKIALKNSFQVNSQKNIENTKEKLNVNHQGTPPKKQQLMDSDQKDITKPENVRNTLHEKPVLETTVSSEDETDLVEENGKQCVYETTKVLRKPKVMKDEQKKQETKSKRELSKGVVNMNSSKHSRKRESSIDCITDYDDLEQKSLSERLLINFLPVELSDKEKEFSKQHIVKNDQESVKNISNATVETVALGKESNRECSNIGILGDECHNEIHSKMPCLDVTPVNVTSRGTDVVLESGSCSTEVIVPAEEEDVEIESHLTSTISKSHSAINISCGRESPTASKLLVSKSVHESSCRSLLPGEEKTVNEPFLVPIVEVVSTLLQEKEKRCSDVVCMSPKQEVKLPVSSEKENKLSHLLLPVENEKQLSGSTYLNEESKGKSSSNPTHLEEQKPIMKRPMASVGEKISTLVAMSENEKPSPIGAHISLQREGKTVNSLSPSENEKELKTKSTSFEKEVTPVKSNSDLIVKYYVNKDVTLGGGLGNVTSRCDNRGTYSEKGNSPGIDLNSSSESSLSNATESVSSSKAASLRDCDTAVVRKHNKRNIMQSKCIDSDVCISPPMMAVSVESKDQRDGSSGYKLSMKKLSGVTENEMKKNAHCSYLQKRNACNVKKSESPRRLSLACPKETELELQRRLSMVSIKESDAELSVNTENVNDGEISKVERSIDLPTEKKLDPPYEAESEVEKHKRLIQKAKEELEQRILNFKKREEELSKRSNAKVQKDEEAEKHKSVSPKTQKKTDGQLTDSPIKHGKYRDTCNKPSSEMLVETRKELQTKINPWLVKGNEYSNTRVSLITQKNTVMLKEKVSIMKGTEIDTDKRWDLTTERECEKPAQKQATLELPDESDAGIQVTSSEVIPHESQLVHPVVPKNATKSNLKSVTIMSDLETQRRLNAIPIIEKVANVLKPQEPDILVQKQVHQMLGSEIPNRFTHVLQVLPGLKMQGSCVQTNMNQKPCGMEEEKHRCFQEGGDRLEEVTAYKNDRIGEQVYLHTFKNTETSMVAERKQDFIPSETELSCSNHLEVPGASMKRRLGHSNPGPPKELAVLADPKGKGRVNERIEKWLNESCSGSLVHKKDCFMIEGNGCKCGIAVNDEDMVLPEYQSEKLLSESSTLGDSNLTIAKVGYPLLLTEVAGEHSYKAEKISAYRLDEFRQTLAQSSTNKHDSKIYVEQTGIVNRPGNLSTSGAQVSDEKAGSLNFMLDSLAEEPVNLPVTVPESDSCQKKAQWQEGHVYATKNVATTQEILNIPLQHTIVTKPSLVNDIPVRKDNIYPDKIGGVLENYRLLAGVANTPSQEVEKSQLYTYEQSFVGQIGKEKVVSENNGDDLKKVEDAGKSEMPLLSKSVTKPSQTPDRLAEKKSIFQQRRSFLHKAKERKDLIPSANAFSPENESSVYAFETEPESPPISTPFRRRARDSRTSSTTTSKSEEDLAKFGEEEVSPPPVTSLPPPVPLQVVQVQRPTVCVALQSSPPYCPQTSANAQAESVQVSVSRTSTSIAVQVNLDSEPGLETCPQCPPLPEITTPVPVLQRSMECSTQTEVTEEDDDESEGHLFYIPLQQAPTPSQQVIQGVAVKLGTEGPTGPNQRVIMRAKLVTKPPNFNRTNSAQDPSIGMRRSLGYQHQRPTSLLMMEQKSPYGSTVGPSSSSSSSGTYPPVGTVQPTTRSRPNPCDVSQSKNDAVTAAAPEDNNMKSVLCTTTDTEIKQSGTLAPTPKSSPTKSNQKQATVIKDKKEKVGEMDLVSPSTSSNTVTSPIKPSSSKVASKERKSSIDQVPHSAPGKSGSGSKRSLQKSKMSRSSEMCYVCTPSNVTTFPSLDSPSQLVEAPTFHPTEKEFQDPLEFIDKIKPVAEKFGLCRVVPPPNFKPECKVTDDMRFTAYNQYVHKMLHRWGPNVKEMMAIKKYLATQSISFAHPPWIGGMEVDLPRLYQTVQSFGGLKEVIEKKRWQRVADGMKIPKSAQDRVTKLDDIYCKYLLPYDTLSPDERQKLFDEVEKEWAQRESRIASQDSSSSSESPEDESDGDITDESEECIVKGRNMPLNAFYRIARNTMSMWFRQPEPSALEVEQEFWRHVMSRTSHVCVHSGSIDSSGWGYGFPCSKNSPFARHPWNLKVLTNNSGSVLRSMGPIMGVTVPTLHVGMLFTTCCWYRDPHGLPWIEYLHTGANKIWYGIPDTYSSVFRSAMSKLVPRYCRNKTIWLPSDTAMVPPSLLVKHGVSLCHTVQEPGQFIVVFPRAFTSSICTGYLVSESVYFAQPSWLKRAEQVFKDIQDSCEPSMFSLERLLFSIASDTRSHVDVLKQVLPMILSIRQQELDFRKQLYNLGLKTSERLPLPEASLKRRKLRPALEEECDYECEICRANLFVSLVTNSHEEGVYCLPHAIELLTRKRHHLKYCKLMYTYDQAELNELIQKLKDRIEAKSQKKSQSKHGNSSAQK